MYLIIGLGVIGLAIVVAAAISMYKDDYEFTGIAEMGFVVMVSFLLLGFVISRFVGESIAKNNPEKIEYKTTTQEIIVLKDGKNQEGDYFLLAGYESKELYYHYAVSTNQGIKVEKIKAENCYIKTLSDGKTPYIEHNEAIGFKNYSDNIFAIPRGEYTVIYVPEGTITTDFSIVRSGLCVGCGAMVDDKYKFCPECGAEIKKE